MAEATTPLAMIHDEFGRARGEATDSAWAFGVSWRLMRRDVEPEQVCEGLEEALALVQETQESPQILFGTPEEHADALYDRWAEEGRLHLWDASRMTWREVPSSGFAWSSFFVVAFMVLFLLRGESSRTWTLGLILLPVGLGLGQATVAATWDSLLRSRGMVTAAIGAGAMIPVYAVPIALLNEWSKSHPFGTASIWWYVPIAASCALLSTTWRRWLDSLPAPPPAGIADVDDWSRELTAILRGRYCMADDRVRVIVGDAHALAADAGRTVAEEFGTPEDYAATFRPDLVRGRLLATRFRAAIAAMWLLPLLWDFSWWSIAAAGCGSFLALSEYRRYRDLRDQT